MNIKSKLTAVALGLAFTSPGFAAAVPDYTIYIAGANGDRDTANTAIDKLLGGSSGSTFIAGTDSVANYKKSNYAIFQGTFSVGGVPKIVRVKTSYIGATGGIYGLAGQHPVKFIADSVIDSGTPYAAANDPTKAGAAQDVVPDIALSTNFQSTSPFNGEYNGHFYESLESEKVSVIPLVWVASPGFTADNLTSKQARLLYGNGRLPLSVFTGSSSDRLKVVFATGRNLDAGQRFVAQTESGIGVLTHVNHYKPATLPTAYGQTIASHALWPYTPGDSTATPPTSNSWSSALDPVEVGNDGVDTGKNLSYVLSATLAAGAYTEGGTLEIPDLVSDPSGATKALPTAGYYIGYLTPGDANAIPGITNTPNGANAVRLKWNGVAYSTSALAEGQYTFWTYEQVFWKSNLASQPGGQAKDGFRQALITQIKTQDASVAGIFLNQVYVSRSGEGGEVSLTYF